ncbi:MAG: NUDIX domain-containing protein [archaeon]
MNGGKKAVGMVVRYENDILLARKIKKPGAILSEKWHLPGETLEEDETDEGAVVRGICQEAGIEVRIERALGSAITPKGTVINWYECVALNGNIRPGSDVDRVKWTPRDNVRGECHPDAVARWPKDVDDYFPYK